MISIFNKDKNLQDNQVSIPKLNGNNDWISSDPVLLKIPIEGNIYCDDQVIIDCDGQLKGNIYSKSCIVIGNISGNINCSEFIELKNRAVIDGNLSAGTIEIEPGSVVNGFISIDSDIKIPAFPENNDNDLINTETDFKKISDESNTKFLIASKSVQLSEVETQLAIPVNNQKAEILSDFSKGAINLKLDLVTNNGRWW
jgi:cytoskeletal protein CcmA (bactofilin family)